MLTRFFPLVLATVCSCCIFFAPAAAMDYDNDIGAMSFLAGGDFSGYIDGTGSEARFQEGPSYPIALPDGDIVVTDTNAFRKVTVAGVVTTWLGSTSSGFVDGVGTDARFWEPRGAALAPNKEFFVLTDNGDHIRKVDISTGNVTSIGEPAPTGMRNLWSFAQLAGIAVLSNNEDMVLADYSNYTIFRVLANGTVQHIAGSIRGDQDGVGYEAQFNMVSNPVVLPNTGDTILVIDNQKVRKVTQGGVVSAVAMPSILGSHLVQMRLANPTDSILFVTPCLIWNWNTNAARRVCDRGTYIPYGVSNAFSDGTGFALTGNGQIYKVIVFPPPTMTDSIAENSPEGTTVGTFTTPSGFDISSFTLQNATQYFTITTDGTLKVGAQSPNYELQPEIYVNVGASYTDAVTSITSAITFTTAVQVTDVVEPFTLTLSSTSIDENLPVGTEIGVFECYEADANSYTVTIISGATEDFEVSSLSLLSKTAFDYETTSSYSITVRCQSDLGGLMQQTFTITINDVPFTLTLSGTSIDENLPVGTEIGVFECSEAGGSSYAVTILSGDTEDFEVSSLSLLSKTAFDYETTSSYSITVRCQSDLGNRVDKAFTITINDVQIAMGVVGRTSVNENLSPGRNGLGKIVCSGDVSSVIYSLEEVDDGSSGGMTVPNANATTHFLISSSTGQLSTGVSLNYEEKSSYKVKVKCVANNDASLSVEKNYSITVNDVPEAPSIASDGATSHTIGVGENLFLTYTFHDEDFSDTVTCSSASYPSWLTFSAHSDNFKIYGTPRKEETGDSSMTVTCKDSTDLSTSATLSFTVEASLRISYPGSSANASTTWSVTTPANTLTVKATLSDASIGRLSVGVENFALTSYDAALGELTVFGIASSVNKELNAVRYVPIYSSTQQHRNQQNAQQQSVSVLVKDNVNFDSPFDTTTTAFSSNQPPQFTAGVSELPSVSVRTNQQLSIHLLSYFQDADGDVITLSATDAGKPTLAKWATLDTNQLVLFPDNSHEGSHTFDITARDRYEGEFTTQITVKVTLSDFDVMLNVLRWIGQIGGPVLSVLLFVGGLFRSRSKLYNHVSFSKYHWYGRFPRELFEGKPFHPQRPPPSALLVDHGFPESPVTTERKRANEVQHVIDESHGLTAMVLTDTTDEMESVPADPQNFCRVVMLVDKQVSGWCAWIYHGVCCGCNCCMCLSTRTKKLGYRLELAMSDLPDWLHYDAATNTLNFYRELVPTEQPDTYLIQIINKDGYMMFETCLPTTALEHLEASMKEEQQEDEPHELLHPHHVQHPLHQQQKGKRKSRSGNKDHTTLEVEAGTGKVGKGERTEEEDNQEGSHHSPFGPRDDLAHWTEKISLLEHQFSEQAKQFSSKEEKISLLEHQVSKQSVEMEELRKQVREEKGE